MIKSLSFATCLLTCMLFSTSFQGCGQVDRGSLPEVYPVSGIVTMDGKAVANATLSFQLIEGSRSAIAQTDERGRYQLTTFHSDDGAIPGEYQITVMQFSTQPVDYPVRQSEDDRNYVDYVPVNMLPEKFSDARRSGLTAVVKPEKNVIDIELK